MINLKTLVTAAAVTLMGAAASAAPMTGTWGVDSVTTGGNDHAFWLPAFDPSTDAARYWQFEGDSGEFTTDGVQAKLTGTIVRNTDAMQKFKVEAFFDYSSSITNDPGIGLKCAGLCDGNSVWDLYDVTSGTLTGLGSIAGTNLEFERHSGPELGQLGFGANDKNDLFGFSTWITWYEVIGDIRGSAYNGDINISLTGNGTSTVVPLPAPVALLLSGLVGMGFVARRRRAA